MEDLSSPDLDCPGCEDHSLFSEAGYVTVDDGGILVEFVYCSLDVVDIVLRKGADVCDDDVAGSDLGFYYVYIFICFERYGFDVRLTRGFDFAFVSADDLVDYASHKVSIPVQPPDRCSGGFYSFSDRIYLLSLSMGG